MLIDLVNCKKKMWNQNELQVHKGAFQLRLRWHNYIYTAKMLCS